MFLLIDPSPRENFSLSLCLNNIWVQGNFSWPESLPAVIEKFLKQQNVTVGDLKGIAVLVGQGRFTATRVAITVANTLAYALNVPVIAIKEIDLENLPAQIAASATGQYASAQYSGPANIGGQK